MFNDTVSLKKVASSDPYIAEYHLVGRKQPKTLVRMVIEFKKSIQPGGRFATIAMEPEFYVDEHFKKTNFSLNENCYIYSRDLHKDSPLLKTYFEILETVEKRDEQMVQRLKEQQMKTPTTEATQ